jgi:hypothetical protein
VPVSPAPPVIAGLILYTSKLTAGEVIVETSFTDCKFTLGINIPLSVD